MLSLSRDSRDLLTVRYWLSLLRISYPLIYALPDPTERIIFCDASASVSPLTKPVSSSCL